MNKIAIIIITLILALAVGLGAIPAAALNPMFVADKTEVEVGETVTFTNLFFSLGIPPYTKAEWDPDGDGVFEITLVGSHAEVMADVVWAYDAPGVYSVILQMTDSTPITYWEERPDYITVTEVAMKGDFDGDGDIDIFDFVDFADGYGSETGDPNYNAIGDFDNDGDIDIFDFVDFADVYGYGT